MAPNQFGFKKGVSATDAILLHYTKITVTINWNLVKSFPRLLDYEIF